MKKVTLRAYAKLNLGLNLLPEKTTSGYYKVYFINTQLKLSDRVKIKKLPTKNDIIVLPDAIEGKSNLAYEAAKTIKERYNIAEGIEIKIKKNIPIKAGLGGGSSDAASVINGMIEIFALNIDNGEKLQLAKHLGMDVCYCTIGGLCEVKGIGDEVYPLQIRTPRLNILLIIPANTKPSTGWAYARVREEDLGRNIDKINKLIEALKEGSIYNIAKYIHNDFERVMIREFPFLNDIKEAMLKYGALNASLAGSGLSIYGIFETKKLMKAAAIPFRKRGFRVICTETLNI